MSPETAESVLSVLATTDIKVLDITGGSPELNPSFRSILRRARELGCHVMVRTNLAIFFEKDMEDLPEFYRDHGVELVASLPYFRQENVDRVRGDGVFGKSMESLSRLNNLGYGSADTGLRLNLIYNPQGIYLPPSQSALEQDYRRELRERFGIVFNKLFALTNMPIGRFRNFLTRTNNLSRYMEMLRCSFNPHTLGGLMCRHLISVGWDGTLHDCDFNQVMGLPLLDRYPRTVRDFDLGVLSRREIFSGEHCYGCTAGQGST
jgi:radical SAM/Cys-rich protein